MLVFTDILIFYYLITCVVLTHTSGITYFMY